MQGLTNVDTIKIYTKDLLGASETVEYKFDHIIEMMFHLVSNLVCTHGIFPPKEKIDDVMNRRSNKRNTVPAKSKVSFIYIRTLFMDIMQHSSNPKVDKFKDLVPPGFWAAFNDVTSREFKRALFKKLERLPEVRLRRLLFVCNSIDGGRTIPAQSHLRGDLLRLLTDFCSEIDKLTSEDVIEQITASKPINGPCYQWYQSVVNSGGDFKNCSLILFALERLLQVNSCSLYFINVKLINDICLI